jgi:hypothetical protein
LASPAVLFFLILQNHTSFLRRKLFFLLLPFVLLGFFKQDPSVGKKILPALLPGASISIMEKKFRALAFRQGWSGQKNAAFCCLFWFGAAFRQSKTNMAGGVKLEISFKPGSRGGPFCFGGFVLFS